MKKIPFSRLLFYILLSGLLPLLFVVFYFFRQNSLLDEQEAYLDQSVRKIALDGEKQAGNEMAYRKYLDADRFYLEEKLETLEFLQNERERIGQLLQMDLFKGHPALKQRQEFLTGKQNRLMFCEAAIQTFPHYKETLLSLAHPVEINTEDLLKILTLIENQQIGQIDPPQDAPQLIVTDFKLERISKEDKEELFKLDLKLLKRDYI